MKSIDTCKYPACFAVFLLSLFCLLTPAGAQTPRKPATVSPVRAHLLVSAEWLAKYLNDPKIIVLHVARDKAHYEAGHIPGARFLALGEMTTTRDGLPNELPAVDKLQQAFARVGVSDDARVVLYSENSGLLAARAFFTLDYLGFGEKAALLDGGLESWKAGKHEISTTAPEIKPGKFTPRINPRVLITREMMRDLSWEAVNSENAGTALIDARTNDDYTGKKGGARVGHIPGAANLHWMQQMKSGEDPSLLPASELRKTFEAAGAASGKKVVTYCQSGMQASMSYFMARYLGYDTAMYDGSFGEWSRTEGFPVVTGAGKK